MKKKRLLIFLLIISLYIPVFAFAETIILKSGKTVEGKLIEKTDKYIKIDFEGIPLIYFLDEIERIEEKSSQPILGEGDNITTSQPNINRLLEDKPLEQQQILEYLDKSDSIIENMNTEIAEKKTLLTQASMRRDKEKMRIITIEMRDLIRQHKEQFLSLPAPSNCYSLHNATLKWFQLQEDIHNNLINGDILQAKILTNKLLEALEIMNQEANSLIQNYKR